MSYGLHSNGVIADKEWFWGEVHLRAANNYGEWNSKTRAIMHIVKAISDICADNRVSTNKEMNIRLANSRKINQIADDMMED